MSEFHGGYFVRDFDGGMQRAIISATRDYLQAKHYLRKDNTLTLAARAGSPVVHLSVRGSMSEGKDYCYWHHEHAALGGAIAQAIDRDVWAYCYENQVGFEMVTHYNADGEQSRMEASWDQLAEEMELDVSRDGAFEVLMQEAPLGVLATRLEVPRNLLDMLLAYDTATCSVLIFDKSPPSEFADYLAGELAPIPDQPRADDGEVVTLYFPGGMASELAEHAARLDVSLGVVATAAWEWAKPEVHRGTPGVGDSGMTDDTMDAPAAQPPAELTLPERYDDPPQPAEAAADKVAVGLNLEPRVLDELRALSMFGDRSLSWCMQSAYRRARAKLFAARRT